MEKFDTSILAQIIIHIQDKMGMSVGRIIHMGNNVFKIDVDCISFLSGHGYTAEFYIEEGKVKRNEPENITMS